MSAGPQSSSPEEGNALMRSLLSLGRASRVPAWSVGEIDTVTEAGQARPPLAASIRTLSLASLCALAGLLALFAAPSQAAFEHNYLSRFSEVPAIGPHGESVPLPGPMSISGANAVTVDGGELYVAEGQTESRIDKFDASTGAFVAQFPQLAPSLVYLDQGIVVGHVGGEARVYVGGDEETEEGTHGIIAVLNTAGELQKIWTGTATPSKERFDCFECSKSGSVAVDNSGLGWAAGDVYVADPQHAVVDVFEPETGGGEKLVAQLEGMAPGEPFHEPYRVTVDEASGELLVADGEGVDIFKPTSITGQYEFIGKLAIPSGISIHVVESLAANDGEGDIYLVGGQMEEGGKAVPDQVFEFNAAGELKGRISPADVPGGTFGSGVSRPELSHPSSVTSDPATHKVYVATANNASERPDPVFVFGPNIVIPDVATGSASNVEPTSATLNGTVDIAKGGAASCQFDWGTTASFGEVAQCPNQVEVEGKVPVSIGLSALQPDTTYYYRLQATNANGTNEGESGQDAEFTTSGPGLRDASASGVAATSATLDATINPHGTPASYYFQYGKSSEYEAEAPPAPGIAIGAGGEDVEVDRHIQGLAPGTVYHYRVVAVSEVEVEGAVRPVAFPSADHTFTTQLPGGAFVLPDGRQWEQVTPANKQGAILGALGLGTVQASLSGGAITDTGTIPTEGNSQGYATEIQIMAVRGPAGWSSKDIQLPHAIPTGPNIGVGSDYRAFSEDLSLGVVDEFGPFTSLGSEASPPDTEETPYLRHNLACESSLTGCYEPLVTGAVGYADVPAGTKFGEGGRVSSVGAVDFVGASSDLAHVLLRSIVPLTANLVENGLYEWSAGKPPAEELQPVSVLPESEGGSLVEGGQLGNADRSVRHAISNDGTRIFWGRNSGGTSVLYLRDTAKGETLRVDAVQGGSGAGEAEAEFQLASSDGSRVFFTDTQPLTSGSGAGTEQKDLYECEISEEAGKLKCALSDLTPEVAGRHARVQGGLLGASEDGSYLYFVATGVLSSAENAQHEKAVAGADNLYVLHHDAGAAKWEAPRLIGVLSGEDRPSWSSNISQQPTRVSPDGRYLAFMSSRSLTGYQNHDASSGRADEEVFLFDARSGRLVCASCNPTGARPTGVEYDPDQLGRIVNGTGVWRATDWLAANIPAWTPFELSTARYQSRYLNDEGRLFFNSSDALVAQDINRQEDAYQYEPAGVGSCSTHSSTFSEATGGCVGLISSGTSPEESAFLEASESGNDVFFLTTEKLLPQDTDIAYDIYDAHACTSQSPCAASPVPSPPCITADACRAAPAPQPAVFGAPASATFSGAGNITLSGPVTSRKLTRSQKLARALKACRKKRARKPPACERQVRKRYGGKQSRKANATNRGNR
jgi:hypothetical protein